ncbi:hypothetical protein ACIBJF_17345 [Streptomyces sp. NPDC050743]|uniref:hypothetical protein n=1 Tax=Streptomyces sp. NPDC050743 TaxID=3365634 RepID=UPI0037BDA61D
MKSLVDPVSRRDDVAMARSRRERKADRRELRAMHEWLTQDAVMRGRPAPPPLSPTLRQLVAAYVHHWRRAARKSAEDPTKTVVVGIVAIKWIGAALFLLAVAIGVVYTVVTGS